DDLIESGNYGVKNLKYILPNLNAWIKDDEDYAQRLSLHSQIVNQYYRYIRAVLTNVGGIYLTEVKEGTKGDLHLSVPKDLQKASLKWALNEYKNSDWIDVPELKEKFPMAIGSSYLLRNRILTELKGLTGNVILSAYYSGAPYTLEEFMKDLYDNTWTAGKLSDGDKAFQKAMVDWFCEAFAEKKSDSGQAAARSYAFSVNDIITCRLDASGLVERYADAFRRYEAEHGAGSVAAHLDLNIENSHLCTADHSHDGANDFGKTGYGFQSKVSVVAIDNSKALLQDMAIKSRTLLRSKAAAASGSDRVHYQSLLIKLNDTLKDKL
ncbi:MAG: zinc-dependent metalloprotease, partial [Prevotellaceae bacterium]|nr:zinc-dependent metalloprotease [Prevotellaceae bacterium]